MLFLCASFLSVSLFALFPTTVELSFIAFLLPFIYYYAIFLCSLGVEIILTNSQWSVKRLSSWTTNYFLSISQHHHHHDHDHEHNHEHNHEHDHHDQQNVATAFTSLSTCICTSRSVDVASVYIVNFFWEGMNYSIGTYDWCLKDECKFCTFYLKNTIRYGGNTALYAACTVNTVDAVYTELRFVATVTTGGRVKFVPGV